VNVLVTGATGFVGSHLCRELIQRGYCVVALSRTGRTQNIESLLPQKEFDLQIGDIRDVSMLRNMMRNKRIKAIFHLAAWVPDNGNLADPFMCFDVNARGTLNVLNAAYLSDVDVFIYSSSMSVYSEPPEYLPVDEDHPARPSTIYGVSKLEGELYCQLYSKTMNITVLRYSGVYGPGERESDAIPAFIKQALDNRPITINGDGTQTSDFAWVEDIVQGSLSALEKNKPGVYNIGSGEEISVNDLAKRIINYTNPKSEIVLTGEDSERSFPFILDITKARRTFGYSPRSFDEGLRIYLKKFNVEV